MSEENKTKSKEKEQPLILINRYDPSDQVKINSNYKDKIERQINYVNQLPPFVVNRMNKRRFSARHLPKHKIRYENMFSDYNDFKIKPSILYKSKNKVSDIFSRKMTKYNTYFPIHYNQNLIPCHVFHRANSYKLVWEVPFDKIDYPKVLTACFEGIIETAHPYKFIARQASKELLLAEDSHDKLIPVISKLYDYIRIALLDKNDETFKDACEICLLLVIYGGEEGRPYIKLLFTPFQRRLCKGKFKDKIYPILNLLCKLFAEEAFYEIKKNIPLFLNENSVY